MTPPPLLHNMSCRPRTDVKWLTHGAGALRVGFHLRHCDGGARATGGPGKGAGRSSGGRRRRGAETPDLDAIEAAWRGFGLRGAVLMMPIDPDAAFGATDVVARPHCWCRDPVLAANVLGRTRGLLLVPSMPFDPGLLDRALMTDDPRILALAGEVEDGDEDEDAGEDEVQVAAGQEHEGSRGEER